MWGRKQQHQDDDRDYDDDDDYRRPPSRGEADQRTRASFYERRRWDPTSERNAADPDNVDREWGRASDRERARYWDRSLRDSGYDSGGRLDARDDPDRQQRWGMERGGKERKKGKQYRKQRGASHVVCVDDTDDAMSAFRHAAKHLPRDDRLILTHGVYEGLLGHSRSDVERLHRVKRKFLNACEDLNRKCEFRQVAYSSNGNFGDEVCSMADSIGARSVIVGRRSALPALSDMRRSLAGSVSESVLYHCELPVKVIPIDKAQRSRYPHYD